MQRPGHKLNTREANPNSYITFIRSLQNKSNPEEAEHILKAIAAQVQRIMRDRFMLIGTLEEAEYNGVFAGRNWNHGQTVELVLRRPNGHFFPLRYIVSVMAHEMAHITHMNHGPDFQKLNKAIRKDIADWQAKGHYGDGFWSDGKRLYDGAVLGAEGLKESELPQYVCGVTKSDAQKSRPRRGRGPASSRAPGLVKGEASLRSGRQTEYRRKAGRRNNADMGESNGRLDGRREITKDDHERRKQWLDARVSVLIRDGVEEKKAKRRAADQFKKHNPWYRAGSSRGKQAKSKTPVYMILRRADLSAAELRAAAAERRLQGCIKTKADEVEEEEEEDELDSRDDYKSEKDQKPNFDFDFSDSDDEEEDIVPIEDPHLSIEERRKELDDLPDDERRALQPEWKEFLAHAITAARRDGASRQVGPSRLGVSNTSTPHQSSSNPVIPIYVADSSDDEHPPSKRRHTVKNDIASPRSPTRNTTPGPPRQPQASSSSGFGAQALVREQRLRALGLAPATLTRTSQSTAGARVAKATIKLEDGTDGWICRLCSLNNPVTRTRCGVCEARPDGSGSIAQ